VDVRGDHLGAPGGPHGAHQLEVLEHGVAVVAPGGEEAVPVHAEGSRPVPAQHPVQQDAPGVDPGVPRQGFEVVGRPHHVRPLEQLVHPAQRGGLVAHVVVGHHHVGVRRPSHARHDAAHLPHGRALLGRENGDPAGEGGPVGLHHLGIRPVDHQHLGHLVGQPAEVVHQVSDRLVGGGAEGQDVGEGEETRHGGRCTQIRRGHDG
jgi:hypothetical protein